jgi:cell division septal protein FtsQ
MALASKRPLIVGSVVLGVALIVGVVYGYLAGVAVLIAAAMSLMVVYMRSHTDVIISGDTQRAAEEWSRKQFGSDEKDGNR